MRFLLFGGIAGAVLAVVVAGVWYLVRRRAVHARGVGRFLVRALAAILLWSAVSATVATPLVLGPLFAGRVGTRGDERGYEGPWIDPRSGDWLFQGDGYAGSLNDDRAGRPEPPDGVREAARARAVRIQAADGLSVRGFFVPAPEGTARFGVVCVHGLFRCAVELERVGAMFRQLGGDVLLLEMRNHGGSGRGLPGFGKHERHDVVGGLDWLAERLPPERPLMVFGVSMGSAAVAFAVPDLPPAVRDRLVGVVLDSPMAELKDAADRRLADLIPWPARPVLIRSLSWSCGLSLADVRPAAAVADFPPDLPVLVVAGSEDEWMPPAQVRRLVERIPGPHEGSPWIAPGIGHGKVWLEAPDAYRERLAAFVERCLLSDRRGR